MNVGIIGSIGFTHEEVIKETLYKLKQEFGDDIVICSGGNTRGAELIVKKYALQFGLQYREYNPAYTDCNLYSSEPESYYLKPYHPSHHIHRYKKLVYACKFIFIFKEKGITDPALYQISKYCSKIKKKFIIIVK